MLDKEQVRKLAQMYAEEIQKVVSVESVILFGSYVNGSPHKYSDIDIAVIVNDFKGDWLDAAAMLCGLTRRVSIYIEPHLMDETCNRSGFLDYVKRTGEVVYEKRA